MRFALAAALTAVTLSLVAAPRDAHAVERQHHIGLAPSLSLLKVDDKSTMSVGMGGSLYYTYGLSDQLNLMAEFNSSIVALDQQQDTPDTPRTRPATVDHLSVGLGYVIDVLRWVPYIGALPGVYRLGGGTLDGSLFLPGAALAVGLDYQLSRHWAIGAAAHQHFLFTKMSTYPTYTTVLLRLEYMWGF
jgi:hypothetical protein